MITSERFEFALKQLSHADWARFERLASAFLASDFPDLRTMANPAGDDGRDSELFSPAGLPFVVLQYSVQQKWEEKINKTVKRLEITMPGPKTIIYVTNQQIGAAADDLKKRLLAKQFMLDIRDRSWFVERMHSDQSKLSAASELARAVVDPLLDTHALDKRLVAGLSNEDAKSALMFLEMQWKDTAQGYGLTKSSFDALVKAALRDTSTESRMKREAIHDKVGAFLPTHARTELIPRVDAALQRLSEKAIRWRKDNDEFHLLESERQRIINSAANIDILRSALEVDLTDILIRTPGVKVADPARVVTAARAVIEQFYLKKGEQFARAALAGQGMADHKNDLKDAAIAFTKTELGIQGRNATEVMIEVVQGVLASASPASVEYLGLLLNSYTLFAFLAATPDVQKVTRQMFGQGELWLDTSVLLPVFGEVAAIESRRPFTAMLKQARAAGLKLYVTLGVVEEVTSHINLCRTFVHTTERWNGRVPFLYAAYALNGKKKETFHDWLEIFAGQVDPHQDVADYLYSKLGVMVEDASDHSRLNQELVDAVKEVWRDIQNARRPEERFNMQARKLADHDAENYLYVLSSRVEQKGRAPLGYTNWWLTMDGSARGILDRIPAEIRPDIQFGPVMSIDFLLRYLAFGPNRERVDLSGVALSQIYSGVVLEALPEDVLDAANEVRAQHAHLPEHVVQRRIRDSLNLQRSRVGELDAAGLDRIGEAISAAY